MHDGTPFLKLLAATKRSSATHSLADDRDFPSRSSWVRWTATHSGQSLSLRRRDCPSHSGRLRSEARPPYFRQRTPGTMPRPGAQCDSQPIPFDLLVMRFARLFPLFRLAFCSAEQPRRLSYASRPDAGICFSYLPFPIGGFGALSPYLPHLYRSQL